MPVSPVCPLYHELEERPVIISQKFFVEEAEHLRRSKGGLSSDSAPGATGTPSLAVPSGHSGDAVGRLHLSEMPRTALLVAVHLVGLLGCSEAAQKCLGYKCVLLVLCWHQ